MLHTVYAVAFSGAACACIHGDETCSILQIQRTKDALRALAQLKRGMV